MQIGLDVGSSQVNLTQTAIHTLFLTTRAWSNTLMAEQQFLLFNHYVVCNETDETIRLQQVGFNYSSLGPYMSE